MKEGRDMTKNFEVYLELDKTGLENKYVIIVNGEIVAKGEDIESMLNSVKQECPNEIPFVAKVPDERMLILLLIAAIRKAGLTEKEFVDLL